MTELIERLAGWRGFRAVVVGDFMLDQLVYGDAERMTADAPVPVLDVRRTEQMAGGAANVCLNLIAMHGEVEAIGVLGDDPEGRALREELERAGVSPGGLLVDRDRPTTVKRNLIGLAQHRHPQKMFRLDFEKRTPLTDALVEALLERFDAAVGEADVVAIEDYGKGVCSERVCREVIERARRAGKPVLVDPASMDDFSRYRGATAVTPNRSEAERATRMREPEEGDVWEHHVRLARCLQESLSLEAVVLTLDRHGALLMERDTPPLAVPTVARTVYDVTGAGDMMLAALVAARANGLGWEDCVRFANTAAGLEVEVFGVKPIPFERIYQAALVEGRRLVGKKRTLAECLIEVSAARREKKTIVFTNGCFDILHAGHIRLLRRAAEFGDVLIVGLNSDESVKRLKGEGRPVHGEHDRVEVLSELESVGLVVVFEEDTPERLLEAIRPDVLVKGADYSRQDVVGGAFVESYGGRVELVDVLEGRSTSGAIERIRGG